MQTTSALRQLTGVTLFLARPDGLQKFRVIATSALHGYLFATLAEASRAWWTPKNSAPRVRKRARRATTTFPLFSWSGLLAERPDRIRRLSQSIYILL